MNEWIDFCCDDGLNTKLHSIFWHPLHTPGNQAQNYTFFLLLLLFYHPITIRTTLIISSSFCIQ